MCLILVAYHANEQWPLVVLGNRDEFYSRPTTPLAAWPGNADILAGRDLQSGGSWMGAHRDGRWAAVTNFREARTDKQAAKSRGWLVRDYLQGGRSARSYLDWIADDIEAYAGFNLLVGDRQGLWHLGNRELGVRRLSAGFYGLSNGLFDAGWPKICKGKEKLARLLRDDDWETGAALDLMMDAWRAPDEQLPTTGVPLEWERALSSMFIVTPDYGTRSTTLLAMNRSGRTILTERHFTDPPQEWVENHYDWSRALEEKAVE